MAPITQLFKQDIALINALIALLNREQTGLINPNIAAVEAIIDEKARLLAQIKAAVAMRNAALAQAGYAPNENGMMDWLQQHAAPAMIQAWTDFQQLIARAKELNRLNGQLIGKHFVRNQQFLNHLKGNPQQDGVYGPTGHASFSHPYHRAGVLA